MNVRRLIIISMGYIYRSIFSTARYRCLLLLASVVLVSCFILSLSSPDVTTESEKKLPAAEQKDKHEKYLNSSIQNYSTVLDPNKIHFNQASTQSERQATYDPHSRYSFIDTDRLDVEVEYLDKIYEPPKDLNIELPSPDSHAFSRIVNVKGDSSIVVYNRIPQCYEYTMGSLLQNISYLHSFNYISSRVYTPFSYNHSSLLAIARSLYRRKRDRLLYERQIYFFDFYSLQFPTHPVWINLIQDPIHQAAVEFERSRELCRKTNRCFVRADTINETLDECVLKRTPQECISPAYGVSRILPFFCGLKHAARCQEESEWALSQAKENIDFFYTVIGFTEEFYKFLYVLEKLLPQYFQLARLLFMNLIDPKILADERDLNITLPNNKTAAILKPLLTYEYKLYEFIKERFFDQYRILVELDN